MMTEEEAEVLCAIRFLIVLIKNVVLICATFLMFLNHYKNNHIWPYSNHKGSSIYRRVMSPNGSYRKI